MRGGPLPRVALAVTAAGVLAGAARLAVGSAAGTAVTPQSHSGFRTCVLTAYPTTSTVETDSWVDEGAKTSNKGGGTALQIQSRTGKNNRAYIRFDLTKCVPALATSASVAAATVRLTLSVAPTGSRTYNINAVTGPCPEAAATCWTETGLTWNNQPTVAAAPTSTLALTATSAIGQYYGFDVTADVAAMVAGTAPNYGWRIGDSAEDASKSYIIDLKSKDVALNSAGAPQLVVVYSP